MFHLTSQFSPVAAAAAAAVLTWLITAAGSLTVFLLPRGRQLHTGPMLAVSGGIMLAASFFSLLQPAVEGARRMLRLPCWCAVALGLAAGVTLVLGGDLLLSGPEAADGRRTLLLVGAITLHNIPEGLAIGVAFGSLEGVPTPAALAGAVSVAVGIGLQNFPEGAAVSLPLLREGMSRRRAFFLGQASGVVEPLAALAGAVLVQATRTLLPWALAAAAGAMLSVTLQELLPAAAEEFSRRTDAAPERTARRSTLWSMAGFLLMMALDVAFG